MHIIFKHTCEFMNNEVHPLPLNDLYITNQDSNVVTHIYIYIYIYIILILLN
jgi:hypothetical protein